MQTHQPELELLWEVVVWQEVECHQVVVDIKNMEKKELTYKQIDKRLGLLIKKVKTLSEMKKKKVQKVLV